MNRQNTYNGWNQQQWATAAEDYVRCGGVLPPEDDLTRALDVMDHWEIRWAYPPSPAVIVGVDVLGRALPPKKPPNEMMRWARLFMREAARQSLPRMTA